MDAASDRRPAGLGFDAVLFELDGVVTRTARLHAAAWKVLFDDFYEAAPPRQADLRSPVRLRATAQPGSLLFALPCTLEPCGA
jgi:hypothetical protein